MQIFGFKPVVAVNRFPMDTEAEIAALKAHCTAMGVEVALSEGWAKGGEGAIELAEKVVEATKSCPSCFSPIYDFEWDIEKKIHTIATQMYGANGVEYALQAKKDLETIKKLGLEKLGICMAKTQKSLSDDQYKKGRPRNFTVIIREIEISSGAGFVVPISGSIMRMPGLPTEPSAEIIDIDADGNISGLF
jgi:formate--tetrahydrofolate ligase